MTKAMGSKDRKEHGFHLSERVDGLASLAKSDSNKKLIMAKEKAIPMIVEILDGKDVSEALAAVKLVWELAFLEDIKKIFLVKHVLNCFILLALELFVHVFKHEICDFQPLINLHS